MRILAVICAKLRFTAKHFVAQSHFPSNHLSQYIGLIFHPIKGLSSKEKEPYILLCNFFSHTRLKSITPKCNFKSSSVCINLCCPLSIENISHELWISFTWYTTTLFYLILFMYLCLALDRTSWEQELSFMFGSPGPNS